MVDGPAASCAAPGAARARLRKLLLEVAGVALHAGAPPRADSAGGAHQQGNAPDGSAAQAAAQVLLTGALDTSPRAAGAHATASRPHMCCLGHTSIACSFMRPHGMMHPGCTALHRTAHSNVSASLALARLQRATTRTLWCAAGRWRCWQTTQRACCRPWLRRRSHAHRRPPHTPKAQAGGEAAQPHLTRRARLTCLAAPQRLCVTGR